MRLKVKFLVCPRIAFGFHEPWCTPTTFVVEFLVLLFPRQLEKSHIRLFTLVSARKPWMTFYLATLKVKWLNLFWSLFHHIHHDSIRIQTLLLHPCPFLHRGGANVSESWCHHVAGRNYGWTLLGLRDNYDYAWQCPGLSGGSFETFRSPGSWKYTFEAAMVKTVANHWKYH